MKRVPAAKYAPIGDVNTCPLVTTCPIAMLFMPYSLTDLAGPRNPQSTWPRKKVSEIREPSQNPRHRAERDRIRHKARLTSRSRLAAQGDPMHVNQGCGNRYTAVRRSRDFDQTMSRKPWITRASAPPASFASLRVGRPTVDFEIAHVIRGPLAAFAHDDPNLHVLAILAAEVHLKNLGFVCVVHAVQCYRSCGAPQVGIDTAIKKGPRRGLPRDRSRTIAA